MARKNLTETCPSANSEVLPADPQIIFTAADLARLETLASFFGDLPFKVFARHEGYLDGPTFTQLVEFSDEIAARPTAQARPPVDDETEARRRGAEEKWHPAGGLVSKAEWVLWSINVEPSQETKQELQAAILLAWETAVCETAAFEKKDGAR